MSFLGKVFGGGGKRQEKGPMPQEAIQKLSDIEAILTKKQEYLEKKVESETALAKKNASKNRKAALQALKRKKRYEKQLGQIDGTLTTIEYQRAALENASTNTEILRAMGYANTALKEAHGNMDTDNVHDMMDDIQEQQEIANEISEAISNPIIGFQDVDQDEINEELERMLQEEIDEKLTSVDEPVEDLPIPPPAVPARQRKVHEEEDPQMRELAQWAS